MQKYSYIFTIYIYIDEVLGGPPIYIYIQYIYIFINIYVHPRDPGSPELRMVSWNLSIMRFVSVMKDTPINPNLKI